MYLTQCEKRSIEHIVNAMKKAYKNVCLGVSEQDSFIVHPSLCNVASHSDYNKAYYEKNKEYIKNKNMLHNREYRKKLKESQRGD
jgi:hypothetical protein